MKLHPGREVPDVCWMVEGRQLSTGQSVMTSFQAELKKCSVCLFLFCFFQYGFFVPLCVGDVQASCEVGVFSFSLLVVGLYMLRGLGLTAHL